MKSIEVASEEGANILSRMIEEEMVILLKENRDLILKRVDAKIETLKQEAQKSQSAND